MIASQANKSIFYDIIVGIWYDVDLGDSTDVQHYFTEDAVLSFDGRELHGRQAIHEGYLERAATDRISRHIVTNLHVIKQDENSADTVNTLHLFAGNGTPVLPNTDPLSVTDTFDHFVKGADGKWLIEHRLLRNVFVRSGATFTEPQAK